MEKASSELRFEEAARWRDALKALENLKETQRVISTEKENLDIVGFSRGQDKAGVLIFHMRDGRIRSSSGRLLELKAGETDERVLARALRQFYTAQEPPESILLPFKVSPEALAEFAAEIAARKEKSGGFIPTARSGKSCWSWPGRTPP